MSLVLAVPRTVVGPRSAVFAAGLGLAALLAAPTAYAIDTMQTAHSGGDASAGPAVQSSDRFGAGGLTAGTLPGPTGPGRPAAPRPG